ncbi:MAG: hypothetical protein AAGF88_03445 [Pseudomonadota bacterium]
MWRPALALSILMGLPSAGFAAQCALNFRIEVTQGVGIIAPGTELRGSAEFTTGQSMRQEGGVMAHLATGQMTLDDTISGPVWTLITTSRDFTADLVGIYAQDVTGFSFAGVDFGGPMVMTLYGRPGTMAEAIPPRTQAEWDALSLRRVLTLHAHGSDMLSGDITELIAECA